MAKTTAKKGSSKKKSKGPKGLSPKTFKGMNPKRFKGKGGGSWSKRLPLKKGATIPCQFLDDPDDFEEYEVHAWREGGRWNFVPCAGKDDCPLCASDDEQQARTSYRFCANVYNLEAKKVQVLEGGSNLATVVHNRYNRKPSSFLKRVFDITMFPTQPVSFQCELAEEEPLKSSRLAKLEKHDLLEYIIGEMKAYYGDDLENVDTTRTSLDDDDDDDDEDEDEYDEDDLDDMDASEIRKIAKRLKIKTVDGEGEKKSKKTLIKAILKKQAA